MIYLFNSARRDGYKANVHNTFYLPAGCVNTYRYHIGQNISEEASHALSSMSRTDVLIVYIDRYAVNGYKFYPLRKGRLCGSEPRDGQVFCDVKLQDYVFIEDLESFQGYLHKSFDATGLPSARQDIEEPHDGMYVQIGDPLPQSFKFASKEDAWRKCVTMISETQAMSSSASTEHLFLRATIVKSGKPISSKGLSPNSSGKFKFSKGSAYDLILTYLFPVQQVDSGRALSLSISGIAGVVENPESNSQIVNKLSDVVKYTLAIKRTAESNVQTIALHPTTMSGTTVQFADATIPLVLRSSWREFVGTVIALSIISVTGALLGLKFDELGWREFWARLPIAIINSGALYVVWRLGRKV
ncbi:MAG: hypothetical protein HY851_09055 [candidate division Zixibacteria bacterium]|nr:hypothetical protein [candidate division Zixibacteria bacterium]